MGVSAAHVSATLAKAGHPRATEPCDYVSGFVVSVGDVDDLGSTVVVSYQDYMYDGDYSNRAHEIVGRICEEAFDGYTGTLRQAGYVVEDWRRYDGVRLGLFVTGREG